MTVKTVRDAIEKAVTFKPSSDTSRGPRVTEGEAKKIIAAAKGGGRVSAAERREVQKFYDSRQTSGFGGTPIMMTLAIPESSKPVFDAKAEKLIKTFLNVPDATIPVTPPTHFTLAIPENP